ncbi:MAG: alpha/beta hydrolase, partial [Candidatus Dadabacteria bacterium]|nr:alpha/beta hydrolase [Candidatus Dadabacteria bacterium]
LLTDYSVIVPDLLGYGKSEKLKTDPDYSFSNQLRILGELIDYFDLRDNIIVGHSYGGVLGTFMCGDDDKGRIKKFVNIEGCITRDTLVLSTNAVRALGQFNHDMPEFGEWLQEGGFRKSVLEDNESASTIKYFDSVTECDPEAFAQTADELVRRTEGEDEQGNNEISLAYKELGLPRIFCAGARPVMDSTKGFLSRNNLEWKGFNVISHWVMLDRREEFYAFLDGFIRA